MHSRMLWPEVVYTKTVSHIGAEGRGGNRNVKDRFISRCKEIEGHTSEDGVEIIIQEEK